MNYPSKGGLVNTRTNEALGDSVLSDYVYGLCFVDHVEVEAFSSGTLRLKVQGGWPNPAWKFDHEEVEVSRGKIRVKLVGKAKRGVVAPAVIAPFSHTLEIKGLKDDEYVVEVSGRGGVVRASIKRE